MEEPNSRYNMKDEARKLATSEAKRFNTKLSNVAWQYANDGFFWPHLSTLWSAPYVASLMQR